MKALIHRIASLKVTVVLLVVVLVALAWGTIVESMHGAPAALRLVYGAFWFRLLLAVYALNLACSLVDLWPWGRSRIGFAITHSSMLIILGGALATELLKTEGRLLIWEGEDASTLVEPTAPSGAMRTVRELPFAVHLDAFEIDYYPGTHRPAQFRSRVTVRDTRRGVTLPAVIEMNRELVYGGYSFFQSSYEQGQGGRDRTVLSVSRDPGQPIVFLGYYVLLAGMLTVLGTRIAQRRRAAVAGLLALGAAGGRCRRPSAVGPALDSVRCRDGGAAPVAGAARRPSHAARYGGARSRLERDRRRGCGGSTRWRWCWAGASTPTAGPSSPS